MALVLHHQCWPLIGQPHPTLASDWLTPDSSHDKLTAHCNSAAALMSGLLKSICRASSLYLLQNISVKIETVPHFINNLTMRESFFSEPGPEEKEDARDIGQQQTLTIWRG